MKVYKRFLGLLTPRQLLLPLQPRLISRSTTEFMLFSSSTGMELPHVLAEAVLSQSFMMAATSAFLADFVSGFWRTASVQRNQSGFKQQSCRL
jgi:hypothetical protein